MKQLLTEKDQGLVFNVVVQPRASKTAVAGRHGEALKVRLTAPPVDGAANKMCLKFLAKWLGVPKTSLIIVSGETSRNKTIRIDFDNEQQFDKEKTRVRCLFDSLPVC
jgi:uncharacterized protein (TIGR00251 family)